MATLPTRLQAQASAITTTTLIHIVVTGDTSQSPEGSSYKANLGQLSSLFGGNTDLYITGGTYSTGTLTLTNLTGGTITVSGFTEPFSGGSGNCITDLYVSNVHSCSPLNVNPNDEGNVYFGSTSGVTIDVINNRLGVNNSDPQYVLDISGTTDDSLQFQTSATAPRLLLSTNQTNKLNRVAVNENGSNTGFEIGVRGTTEPSFSNYGKQGDTFVRSSNNSNGLNIIEGPESSLENYIRFFAGQNANTTPDIHIQGSGSTRGYIGIGTGSPTEKLDINGKTKTINLQVTSGATSGYVLTSDSEGNAMWEKPNVLIDPYINLGNVDAITWDLSGNSINYEVILTGNTTLDLINVRNGETGSLIVSQDVIGGKSITLGTINGSAGTHKVVNNGGGAITLTPTSNATDILTFTYNNSTMYWMVNSNFT